MTCRHANRSDCAQFGERPSKEWYADMIQQTEGLDDHLPCGGQARIAGGLPFGIIDPDYARYYTLIRTTAWQCGYAIGLHGSFTRDLDLIAAPWTAQALPAAMLIQQIEYRTDLKRQEQDSREKPHGRMCWSLLLPGFTDPRWIDLSVMPCVGPIVQDKP